MRDFVPNGCRTSVLEPVTAAFSAHRIAALWQCRKTSFERGDAQFHRENQLVTAVFAATQQDYVTFCVYNARCFMRASCISRALAIDSMCIFPLDNPYRESPKGLAHESNSATLPRMAPPQERSAL